jgi:hypothetical protein
MIETASVETLKQTFRTIAANNAKMSVSGFEDVIVFLRHKAVRLYVRMKAAMQNSNGPRLTGPHPQIACTVFEKTANTLFCQAVKK